MPAYNSNNSETIQELFSLEGDALARAGFSEPADVRARADDTVPSIPAQIERTEFLAAFERAYPRPANVYDTVAMIDRNVAFTDAARAAGFLAVGPQN